MIATGRDIFLDDNAFLKLGFRESECNYDKGNALSMLKADPELGARFLGKTGGMDGDGTIYWSGELSGAPSPGGTAGVRIRRLRDGDQLVGDNTFGVFLSGVRDAYRQYLRTAVLEEKRPARSRVVTDFTRKGETASDIEKHELDGEEFIHTDAYRPARRRFDTGLDGTTGHAQRAAQEEVPFHSFVCPFGTSYLDPLKVSSAAEASMLYEKGIRGELDWKALMRNLTERELLSSTYLTDRQKEKMAEQYSAQFAWMRDQIASNPELRNRPIVAASALIADDSFGRSLYDAQYAPSPAHVLERYLDNPLLLYAPSENCVVRALAKEDKAEPVRFRVNEGQDGTVSVLVIGSDTIGGREPGAKASAKYVQEQSRDENGNWTMTKRKVMEIPQKSKAEIEIDYASFRARMDEVLREIPDGRPVRLITGSSSTMSENIGVGTPRMVERYVRDRGGRVSEWNFSKGVEEQVVPRSGKAPEVTNPNLSAVLMGHFAMCAPTMVGKAPKVDFLLDPRDPETDVTFSAAQGLTATAAVCFSTVEDSANRNVLALGSLAVDAGLPVIHVQENRTEQLQRSMLQSGAVLSSSFLAGDVVQDHVLFTEGERLTWDISSSNNLSFVDRERNDAVPFVANRYPAGVSVGGYTYNSAYGAYGALLAKELGAGASATMLSIQAAEGDPRRMAQVLAALPGAGSLTVETEEKCIRQAVRLMADANTAFADRLYDLDSRDIVMPASNGDNVLFTDPEGRGANRFGVVLAAERDRMKELREARRLHAEEERIRVLEEAARKQRVVDSRPAEGQKVQEGLPRNLDEAKGAVWFIGTHSPDQLILPDDASSFEMWNTMRGEDRLTRAKAVMQRLPDSEGNRIENNYVFLFPSDLEAVTGRRRGNWSPDSTNLTDCRRKDPATGEEFTCAFGVPVRFNIKGIEPRNKDLLPCSYRLDNDAANYAKSLVLADSQARVTAIRHGMQLMIAGGEYRDEHGNLVDRYFLGTEFSERIRDPKAKPGQKAGYVDNPHASPLNEDITNRYISMLERGASYPLTVIPMSKAYYSPTESEEGGKYSISAEGRFISDLNFSLRVANATALALGVPMRFPLDKQGRIDLGPGVPEEFRTLAEQKIDAFIGVIGEKELSGEKLPLVERLSWSEGLKVRQKNELKKAGDLYMRPNDLVPAFGPYEFDELINGGTAPLHEMSFRMDDDFFYVVDAKLSRGLSLTEINKYVSYEKNDMRRFTVRSTNPDRVPEFKAVLQEYAARAKAVTVEMGLVREGEIREGGSAHELDGTNMKGFVNLLDSNSDEFVQSEHDIGREATTVNAVGRVNASGAVEDRNVAGDKVSGVYYGSTQANDGFAGYAQVRYSYDGSPMSPWRKIEDLELAKDVVMTLVNRKYSSLDSRVVPPANVLDMMLKAEAMSYLVAEGTVLEHAPQGRRVREADDKVVSIGRKDAGEALAPEKVNVFAGAGENVILSNFAVRPFDWEAPDGAKLSFRSVEQGFQYMKSYYAKDMDPEKVRDYRTAVLATEDGKELRTLGRSAVTIDRDAWDAASAELMRGMVRRSFDPDRHPDAVKALLATGDATLTHEQDGSRWKTEFPEILTGVRDELKARMAERKGGNLYVTYYGSRNVPENALMVQISTSAPGGMQMDVEFESLYPNYKTMVKPHKEGKIDDAEYVRRYASQVLGPAKDKILSGVEQLRQEALAEGKDVYFFCYEKPGDFCHRYLLANFLNENGIKCMENPKDRDLYITGRVPLVNDVAPRREAAPASEPELPFGRDAEDAIVFTESRGGYRERTIENATANDVDFTLAFGVDFSTYGELATAKAAGDSLIQTRLDVAPGGGLDLSPKAVKEAVRGIVEVLPEEYVNGEPCGLNIAGNGIYTLSGRGITQEQSDEFVTRVVDGLRKEGMVVSSIRTGGQSGIDEAGAVAGVVLDIPTTVNAPKGYAFRKADNKDVRDEKAFKARFAAKDVQALRAKVGLSPAQAKERTVRKGRNI